MPSKRQSSNKRAQGGGRNPNSEPRLQVFRDFSGVNFENAERLADYISVDMERTDLGDQTDLQMNYVFLQNNAAVRSNKTIEVRDDLVKMFTAPMDGVFTGPVCLIGSKLYAAYRYHDSNSNSLSYAIGIGDINEREEEGAPYPMRRTVRIDDQEVQSTSETEWTSLEFYDNKLIAMTKQNEMWTGDVGSSYLVSSVENAVQVPDPTTDFTGHLTGRGDLVISEEMTDNCPYRIEIAEAWVNKYGPTKVSPNTVFYANHPVSEWHAGRFLRIDGEAPTSLGITAVELYYTTDNAMSLLFLGRVDITRRETPGSSSMYTEWTYDWYGYIDATSMWPIANLIAPTENYTKGVHASRVKAIDGRLYFWGDKDNPQRLYIGGNPGNLLSVSSGTGGGFVDVEPGTNQSVKYVCKYKTQSGNSIVTMLCDSPNSRKEQRYNLVENTISLSNEQSMKSWQAEQVAGAVGCKSYDGAVVCEDGLYSISRYGLALTTMTMEYNAQIRTNYVSEQIKPIFTNGVDKNSRLSNAHILELDNVIYMALGRTDDSGDLDNVLFCYDIGLKAWWTYTLDVDQKITNLFHIDWEQGREGIGIVAGNSIYLLPTTVTTYDYLYPQTLTDDESTIPNHSFLIETAQISTQMPQQSWQYLSQLEFHFDYFVGDMDIHVRMIDIFGRDVHVRKHVSEEDSQFDYVVRMRVDQKVMSYVITMSGQARFRLTHFLARVYVMSNKIGQVWGFDDSVSYRSSGSIHPTFKCYNDVRKAIFT